MKENFKKTLCAALAGLMLTLTACGNVAVGENPDSGKSDDISSKADENTSSAKDVADPAAVDLSVELLSEVNLNKPDNEPNEEFYSAYRNFAAELFARSCENNLKNGENAMISPESVMMALGMTANGACGETLAQMEAALGGTDIDRLNEAMLYLTDRAINSVEVKFNIANSVWVRDNEERIQMSQSFCDKVKSFYDADSFLAPFDQTTCADINGWVNNETNGMIPEILNNIPLEAVAYLVNAMAFEGEWREAYEDAQVREDGSFTNSKGEEERVTMLYSTESTYLHDDNTEGFLKYYNGHYAFMGLLPEEGTDIADYVSALDGDKLTNLWNSRNNDSEVYTAIPEFTADHSSELSAVLQDMGMELPFSANADFSGMAETGSGSLYISRVLHKTHIEVDRHGTKAAAATAIEMVDECAVLIDDVHYVYLDRPFVYAIVDTMNGMPIFIGAVNSVNG